MRACGQKLVKFCTLTHAAKLVVRIIIIIKYNIYIAPYSQVLYGAVHCFYNS